MGVGKIPGRKHPCLWIQDGARMTVLAHFKDEAAMRVFLAFRPKYTPPHPPYSDEPEREIE